jgi:hypothetical protein
MRRSAPPSRYRRGGVLWNQRMAAPPSRAVSFLQSASELGRHRLRSISLTHGADDLDARGRSLMCRQRSRPSLGGEAGGRSLGFISLISFGEPRRPIGSNSHIHPSIEATAEAEYGRPLGVT